MPKGYRNVNVPKVDLSKYNSFEKLPISIEKILVEALIAFNANTKTVSEHFNISEDKVSEVLIKYYSSISEIYQNNIKTKPMEDALNKAMEMMKKHITEVKSAQDSSSIKALKSAEIGNICKMVDRITTVREAALKSYDLTINKLNANIAALKMTESRTEGKIEDDSDYLENQQTVFEKMAEYQRGYSKKTKAVSDKTGEVREFNTLNEMAAHFNTTPEYIRKKINNGNLYKEEWRLYFV